MANSKTLAWYRATGLHWVEAHCKACELTSYLPLRMVEAYPPHLTLDEFKAKLRCHICGTKDPEVRVLTGCGGNPLVYK